MIKPVGYVRNAVKKREQMRLEGARSVIEMLPAYRKALEGLTASHIWVIAFLHRADRSVLRARPRKVSSTAAERGVFALRSPDRPNPLALSCARVRQIRGRRIYVEALDLIDGTPIVDIKPYSPGIDSVPAATQPDYSSKYALMADDRLAITLRRILANHFLRLRPAHIIAAALVFKYIRASGKAPGTGLELSVRGGAQTARAVEALFGCGAVCRIVNGVGAPRLIILNGKKRYDVSCSRQEIRNFTGLAAI